MHKRGIFGGTFDPIHGGHLKIAQTALDTYAMREVLWIPQLAPLHKKNATPIAHRWAMVELAIAPYPQFRLPTTWKLWQAIHSKTQDYAIDTFHDLQKLYPDSSWFWILGVDNFLTLPRWKGREVLIPACTWVVAPRDLPSNLSELNQLQPPEQSQVQAVATQLQAQGIDFRWDFLPLEAIAISSSLVRQTLQAQQPLDHLLPKPVAAYIMEKKLYSGYSRGNS